METLYQRTAERLLEKLEAHRFELNFAGLAGLDPVDTDTNHLKVFEKDNPLIHKLKEEVETQFEYEMSEAQCIWAVDATFYCQMGAYNRKHGRNLSARA